MRFLSVAACALAASLLSASTPAAASVYHLDGGSYSIVGDMSAGADVTFAAGGSATLMPRGGGFTTSYFSSAYLIQIDGLPEGFVAIGLTQDCFCDAPYSPPITYHLNDTERNFRVWGQSQFFNVVAATSFLELQLPDNLSLVSQNGPIPAVPEPSTFAMLLLGLAGLAGMGLRRAG